MKRQKKRRGSFCCRCAPLANEGWQSGDAPIDLVVVPWDAIVLARKHYRCPWTADSEGERVRHWSFSKECYHRKWVRSKYPPTFNTVSICVVPSICPLTPGLILRTIPTDSMCWSLLFSLPKKGLDEFISFYFNIRNYSFTWEYQCTGVLVLYLIAQDKVNGHKIWFKSQNVLHFKGSISFDNLWKWKAFPVIDEKKS